MKEHTIRRSIKVKGRIAYIYISDIDGIMRFPNHDAAIDATQKERKRNGFEYEPVCSIGTCKRCGKRLYPSDVDGYTSQCFECNEDFYAFEQVTDDG